ncbi:MAG: MMPL family transporter [Dehalococcoidia bacterium]
MNLSTENLARASANHPWRTLAIWAVAILAGLAITATLFADATTTEQDFTYDPEAKVANRLIEERLRGPSAFTETVVIRSDSLAVDDPAFRERVQDVARALRTLGPDVLNVQQLGSYYDLPDGDSRRDALVSPSRQTTIIPVVMTGDVDEVSSNIHRVTDIAAEIGTGGGFEAGVAGQASINADFQEISERDLLTGETIGIGIALVILLLVFRTAGAAWIPIVMALISISLAVAAASLIGQVYKLSFFVVNMITMIGLAVGIDYTLFIVARYREERGNGLSKLDAISKSGATASRAVVFSGLTVVFALMGMLIVPTTIFFSLALGAILVVIMAVMLAVTLLPAILSLMDNKVNALRLPFLPRFGAADTGAQRGFWNWVTRSVMRRPALYLVIGGGALIAATVPYFGINPGFNGVGTLPDEFPSKWAFNVLQEEFPNSGNLGLAEIVIDGDANSTGVTDAVARLQESVAGDPIFGPATYETNDAGNLGVLSVIIRAEGSSDDAVEAVRSLRESYLPAAGIPAPVYVGGNTAFNLDFFDLVADWTPIVLVFVLSLSFVLLTVVFRSLVVPVKAIILNLLSVGSAYGLLVLVSQQGIGADLLGFQQVEAIEAWIPLFLFSVLFGLSMDYEVFLLSRVRERFDQTHNNDEAVAFGLRSTAGIITGAALIMVGVFSGFAMGDLVMFQQLGFGLGVAIFVDAFIVRTLLVPSSMKLLGNRNWYLPKFLHWLPDLRVEGSDEPTPPTVPANATTAAAD